MPSPKYQEIPEPLRDSCIYKDADTGIMYLVPPKYFKKILAALNSAPDGRYRKQKKGKKWFNENNKDITIQDILPETSSKLLYSILKLKNNYYVIADTINAGGYGKAKFIQNIETGTFHVLKTMESSARFNIPDEEVRSDVVDIAKQEVEVLEALNMGTGMIIREVQRKGEKNRVEIQCNFIMDYAPGESLSHIIKRYKKAKQNVPFPVALSIGRGILDEVIKLRNKGYLHCDLKPENIIYDRTTGKLTLVDYGSAVKIADLKGKQKDSVPEDRGTRAYMSPERKKSTGFNEKAEVYSVGLILGQLFGFGEMVGSVISQSLARQVWEAETAHEKSPDKVYYHLCKQMANEKEKDRPDLDSAQDQINKLYKAHQLISLENLKKIKSFLEAQINTLSEKKDKYKARCEELMFEVKKIQLTDIKFINNDIQAVSNLLDILLQEFEREYKKIRRDFLGKEQDPIEVLNKNKNKHIYAREIGNILKALLTETSNTPRSGTPRSAIIGPSTHTYVKLVCDVDFKNPHLQALEKLEPAESTKASKSRPTTPRGKK